MDKDALSRAMDMALIAQEQICANTGVLVRVVVPPEEYFQPDPRPMMHIIASALSMPFSGYATKSRERSYVELRFVASLLIQRYYPTCTLKETGRLFGGMDHTSVVHCRHEAQNLLRQDYTPFVKKFNRAYDAVVDWLKNLSIVSNEENVSIA